MLRSGIARSVQTAAYPARPKPCQGRIMSLHTALPICRQTVHVAACRFTTLHACRSDCLLCRQLQKGHIKWQHRQLQWQCWPDLQSWAAGGRQWQMLPSWQRPLFMTDSARDTAYFEAVTVLGAAVLGLRAVIAIQTATGKLQQISAC